MKVRLNFLVFIKVSWQHGENLDKFGTNDGLRKITAETDV